MHHLEFKFVQKYKQLLWAAKKNLLFVPWHHGVTRLDVRSPHVTSTSPLNLAEKWTSQFHVALSSDNKTSQDVNLSIRSNEEMHRRMDRRISRIGGFCQKAFHAPQQTPSQTFKKNYPNFTLEEAAQTSTSPMPRTAIDKDGDFQESPFSDATICSASPIGWKRNACDSGDCRKL